MRISTWLGVLRPVLEKEVFDKDIPAIAYNRHDTCVQINLGECVLLGWHSYESRCVVIMLLIVALAFHLMVGIKYMQASYGARDDGRVLLWRIYQYGKH